VKVVRAWSLLTAVLGMFVCMVAGPLLNSYTFSWGDHTLHFMLLAPAVGLMAITGGETAILKGARRLRALAVVQIGAVLAALVVSVPIYYFFGQAGIVPVIVLMALVLMLLTVYCSYRLYPLRLSGARGLLGEGMEMVKLGVAYTLAGIVGSASEMLIRSYLNVVSGDLDVVGLYNVGYMITITYASMVFSAMETDYFPRLSAVSGNVAATNVTVNKQMEVSLLILAPMLVGLIMLLPVLVPLLFSSKFLPVLGMTQVAVLAMYMKVQTMPIAYITLARGYSLSFLFLETVYFIALVAMVIGGYRLWGLYGTGLAIVGAHVFELLTVGGYAYFRYGYRYTGSLLAMATVQTAFGVAAYVVSLVAGGWIYWIAEAALAVASTAYSLLVLRRKTRLWQALRRRVLRHRA
jgi:O-antigen/teichoic acid export membrane protein